MVKNDSIEIELVHESTSGAVELGGQAELRFADMSVSFTSIIDTEDGMSLRGPLGTTVVRIDPEGETVALVREFAEEHEDDIKYINSRSD